VGFGSVVPGKQPEFYTIIWYLSHLMFTYLALLISYVYNVFYTALTLLVHMYIVLIHSYLDLCVLGICCVICKILDITALSELRVEVQAFRHSRNDIC
jgi:hypothetical protein